MSILLDCQDIEKTHGTKLLFKHLSFGLFEGDQVGVVGNNGTGKSTLMKILADLDSADSGQVVKRSHLKVAYAPQSDSFDGSKTILDVLLNSSVLESQDASERELTVQRISNKFGITDLSQQIKSLSGGWKKRVLIVEALLVEPDLLLLDEPTNHLDIDNILWLESILQRASFSWVAISHDRQFLENTVNKVAELSPRYPNGIFFSVGGYQDFLSNKKAYFDQEKSRLDSMENKMRIENAWLQRGPKARTTKAKARIDRAGDLQGDLKDLKSRLKDDQHLFDFSSSKRQSKRLIELMECRFAYDGGAEFGPFNILIHKNLRLGLLGRNGTGKSTLIKLMMKKLTPTAGEVKFAENLRAVYFDQQRESLDENLTLKFALSDNGEQVVYRDQPIHIVTWAKKFLFQPEQLDTPVAKLSGGEKAKVVLANLMLKPADVLALDEPTNDLDINALETLEESIKTFNGAVIIISHDRYFLESVCNAFLGFDREGQLKAYVNYDQWELETKETKEKKAKESKSVPKSSVAETESQQPDKKKKLSYMEQREYDSMETEIMNAEEALEAAQKILDDPGIASNAVKLGEASANFNAAQSTLDKLYARWAELEEKIN